MTARSVSGPKEYGSFRAVAAAAVVAALALAGCAGMGNDEAVGTMLVSPGKYDIYTCPQLAEQARTARNRELELADLMARASQSAGGAVVNSLAYRTDYLQSREQQKMIAARQQDKKCDAEVPAASTQSPDAVPAPKKSRRSRG